MSEKQRQRRSHTAGKTGNTGLHTASSGRADVGDRLRAFFRSYDDLFLLTGPAETGKTTLVTRLLAEIEPAASAAMLDAADLPESTLLKSVCRSFGLASWPDDWEMTLNMLWRRLRPHDHTFLVIDNAHRLEDQAFDDIKLLSYLRSGRGPLLQAILVGHDELLPRVEACDLARLGAWQIQRQALIFPREYNLYAVDKDKGEITPEGELVPATELAVSDGHEYPSNDLREEIDESPDGLIIEAEAKAVPDLPPAVADGTDHPGVEVVSRNYPAVARAGGEIFPETASRWSWFSTMPGKAALAILATLLVYLLSLLHGSDDPDPVAAETGKSIIGAEREKPPVPGPLQSDREAAIQTTTTEVNRATDYDPPPVAGLAPVREPEMEQTAASGTRVVPADETQPPAIPEDTARPAVAVPREETRSTAVEPVADEAGTEIATALVDAEAERQAKTIAGLLTSAEAAIEKNYLSTPAEQSAWNYYSQVLAIDPENLQAQQGMQDIVDLYSLLTRREMERQNYDTAQRYVDRGLEIAADHRELFALEDELTAAIARRAARLQEQQEQQQPAATEVEPDTEVRELGSGERGLFDFLRGVFTPADQSDIEEEP